MVDKLLNLILTSNCPTVSIFEFELAPFAEFKSDGNNFPALPPKLFIKYCSLIATPDGIRAPVSMSYFVSTKFVPVHSMSIDIAPSRNEVASIMLMSDLFGFWLEGKCLKWLSTLWYLPLRLTQYVGCPLFSQSMFLCCPPQYRKNRDLHSRTRWPALHLKHVGCLTSLCWMALTFCWECVLRILCWNWRIASHNVAHWKGRVTTMDAVSLPNSVELKPSQIFFNRRDAWDIVQPELGPQASSAVSLHLWRKACTLSVPVWFKPLYISSIAWSLLSGRWTPVVMSCNRFRYE